MLHFNRWYVCTGMSKVGELSYCSWRSKVDCLILLSLKDTLRILCCNLSSLNLVGGWREHSCFLTFILHAISFCFSFWTDVAVCRIQTVLVMDRNMWRLPMNDWLFKRCSLLMISSGDVSFDHFMMSFSALLCWFKSF